MISTDRRSFLKGMMAAMALVAVPMPAIAEAIEVAAEPSLPDVEQGEIWWFDEAEQAWSQLGTATRLDYKAERSEPFKVGPGVWRDGDLSQEVKATVVAPYPVMDQMHRAVIASKNLRLAFGMYGGKRLVSPGHLIQFWQTMEGGGRLPIVVCDVIFTLTGTPEISA